MWLISWNNMRWNQIVIKPLSFLLVSNSQPQGQQLSPQPLDQVQLDKWLPIHECGLYRLPPIMRQKEKIAPNSRLIFATWQVGMPSFDWHASALLPLFEFIAFIQIQLQINDWFHILANQDLSNCWHCDIKLCLFAWDCAHAMTGRLRSFQSDASEM